MYPHTWKGEPLDVRNEYETTVGQEKNRIFSPTVSSRGCIAVAAAH